MKTRARWREGHAIMWNELQRRSWWRKVTEEKFFQRVSMSINLTS
jgi:hypothetical protein